MSSRALRKIQREQEKIQREQEQQRQLQETHDVSEIETSEDEQPMKPKALNAFDLLNQANDDGNGENDNEEDVESPNDHDNTEAGENGKRNPMSKLSKSKSKQKKKKKANKKPRDNTQSDMKPTSKEHPDETDEIDLALKSLSTHPSAAPPPPLEDYSEMYRLLAVDSKYLNATNEMKRLFGNVVLEGDNDEPVQSRRRGRIQHLDLGGALAGRNSPVSRGQGLAGLALRRNVFIPGKEEWPKATSGGLGMELVEKLDDGTIEYRFVHNTAYQDVQRQFETCVESLDPQRMIHLLQFNPYHISTLLQVSEIAKQQGDHSVSGDLLERALFSFGRSVHSSFITALSEGKARLDFRRPENREFWLAAWRYVANLGQRGTWRTSYEWAKLVLSLDPEGDPYCVGLNLDQLALRGGQAQHFLSLVDCRPMNQWFRRANLSISLALAEHRLKNTQRSRLLLGDVIQCYPFIFLRLFQELNLDHPPKSIWGQKPRTAREEFDCEVYVHNAKDLWNTPEAISLLVEVAETTERRPVTPISDGHVTLDEARHILLSGIPALINLLPRSFTTMQSTASDPLPPPDNLPSYRSATSLDDPEEAQGRQPPPQPAVPAIAGNGALADDEIQELQGLQGFFSRIMPWFRSNAPPDTSDDAGDEIERAAAESGIPEEVITERSNRLVQLLQRVLGRANNDESLQPQAAEQGSEMQDPRAAAAEPAPSAVPGRRGSINPDEYADFDNFVPAADATAVGEQASSPAASVPTSTSTSQQHHEPQDPLPYDDERNQRWLAGQGMLHLKEFTTQHGVDENTWGAHTAEGKALVSEYAGRVLQLRQQKTRDFIVNYPLRQGAGEGVRELVRMWMERERQRQR
ncbi:MAG: hypothetical protein Q9201_002740 [Fulgogasparrea decipioides]